MTQEITSDIQQEKLTKSMIQNWITTYLGELLEIEPNEIDPKTPFERYGLDSAAAVGLAGDLEEWLELEVDITWLYDYPTIAELSEYLAQECAKA